MAWTRFIFVTIIAAGASDGLGNGMGRAVGCGRRPAGVTARLSLRPLGSNRLALRTGAIANQSGSAEAVDLSRFECCSRWVDAACCRRAHHPLGLKQTCDDALHRTSIG